MKTNPLSLVEGSILAPQGFRAAGVFCDIKRIGTGKGSQKGAKRDLALIVSEVPAAVAGMFTTNQVCAAPVKLCIDRVRHGVAQAIVANSGNANACTGPRGLRDAQAMARRAARGLHLPEAHVLVASTGRIGLALPMPNINRGIDAAVAALDGARASAAHAAESILTSDTRTKQIAVACHLGGKLVHIGGIAKGAGMIQPGMSATGRRPAARSLHATMLAFLTTDAALNPGALRHCLEEAVAQSFNRITVDGDMSTNDTVLILANGLAGNPVLQGKLHPTSKLKSQKSKIAGERAALETFQAALNHVCLELARMIVRDGEGVHRVVTVRVEGALTAADADAAARAVANSPWLRPVGTAAIPTGAGSSMPSDIPRRGSRRRKSTSVTACRVRAVSCGACNEENRLAPPSQHSALRSPRPSSNSASDSTLAGLRRFSTPPTLPRPTSITTRATSRIRRRWAAEGGPAASSGEIQGAGAVAEAFHGGPHVLEHGDVEVAEGGPFGTGDVTAGAQASAAAASQQDRQVGRIMAVAVGHARSEQYHAVVQQGAVAFLDGCHLVHQVGKLLGVPAVDLGVRLELLGLVLVMTEFVMRSAGSGDQLAEVLA
jgi:glutamate N-acetyltransferase / amino-acid N-acetyltransferase